MQQTGKIGVIVDDMFFAAKIASAAQAAGRSVERIRSREQLESDIVANPPQLVILDLNSDRLDPLAVIGFFKSQPELIAIPIVGFVSHVQTDLIRQAQTAGCDYVLPRSAFTQMLLEIAAGNLSSLGRKQASQ